MSCDGGAVVRDAVLMHLCDCRYGYKSVWEVEQVVSNYSAASLPLEAIWTDIDHCESKAS